MIPALRVLTGLSISAIRNRVATAQTLFEVVPFRNDWNETRHKLVQIARQIEDGSMPLTVTERTNGVDSAVPLPMLMNLIQGFRETELQTQTDIVWKPAISTILVISRQAMKTGHGDCRYNKDKQLL